MYLLIGILWQKMSCWPQRPHFWANIERISNSFYTWEHNSIYCVCFYQCLMFTPYYAVPTEAVQWWKWYRSCPSSCHINSNDHCFSSLAWGPTSQIFAYFLLHFYESLQALLPPFLQIPLQRIKKAALGFYSSNNFLTTYHITHYLQPHILYIGLDVWSHFIYRIASKSLFFLKMATVYSQKYSCTNFLLFGIII